MVHAGDGNEEDAGSESHCISGLQETNSSKMPTSHMRNVDAIKVTEPGSQPRSSFLHVLKCATDSTSTDASCFSEMYTLPNPWGAVPASYGVYSSHPIAPTHNPLPILAHFLSLFLNSPTLFIYKHTAIEFVVSSPGSRGTRFSVSFCLSFVSCSVV